MISAAPHNTPPYYNGLIGYFWQWAEEGSVLEWGDGRTICYSRDLMQVQEDLLEYGWPPLGSLLLLIGACGEHFEWERTTQLLQRTYESLPAVPGNKEAAILSTLTLLKNISRLPSDLRTGPARIHLIREVIDPRFLHTDSIETWLSLFRTGQVNYRLEDAPLPDLYRKQWDSDIEPLAVAGRKWEDGNALLRQLQTGLKQTPAAPEIDVPQISSDDLLTQMAKDRQLAGLAQLTRRLLAVIRVPMHTARQGALSYGGISDISNRGNYDRLLLSELAQDEELLTARLVNLEALFLQREEPPADPRKTRVLLVDCSVRMWGQPRVFAFAAALATAQQSATGIHTRCVLLGGEKYFEADLQTLEGVRQAFSWLEPGLHCGAALEKIFPEIDTIQNTDIFFFTGDTQLGQRGFLPFWSAWRREMDFLVLVNRNGHIEFMSGRDGAMKRIGEARLNLETLLKAPTTGAAVLNTEIAFYKKNFTPLLAPSKYETASEFLKLFTFSEQRWLGITNNRRVLTWLYAQKGCLELFAEIELGDYWLADNRYNTLYLLVVTHNKTNGTLYTINLAENRISKSGGLEHIFTGNDQYKVTFYFDLLEVRYDQTAKYYDLHSKNLDEKRHDAGDLSKEQIISCRIDKNLSERPFLSKNRKQLFYRISQVAFSTTGVLIVGKHQLVVRDPAQLKFVQISSDIQLVAISSRNESLKDMTGNKRLASFIMRWPDGSQAITDARGFLHLKSSNPAIPEITIALVLESTTACWASDGTGCGSTYFFRPDFENIIPVQDFYTKYIQAFFRQLIK